MVAIKILIYDIEVFKEDWFFTAREPDSNVYTVIHNDNHALREFIGHDDIILGGFNNKHYDDGIIHAMYHGADNATVKAMNDFIIGDQGNWWEFEFVNFKKKMFKSFDLRDDLPINLSLKAIEGNMGEAIVESSVPFDIDRKLTPSEIEEVIKYNKVDVDNTIRLYHKRQAYLDSKKAVARLKGIDEYEAVGLTNAKLTARFLDAKKELRVDEFEYPTPDTLQIDVYKHVVDFFKNPIEYTLNDLNTQYESATNARRKKSILNRIEKLEKERNVYDCKLETKIAGVNHIYAWGGIHGARTKYLDHADETHNIVTVDVASYYPSLMLEYDFISRNIPSKKGYADIYHRRMKAKAEGDKQTSDALKLVLNTCYGAMKNQYNDLYDPRNAIAICVGGQLLLTDLIEKLETVKGFKLIQSNTDGLMIKYPRANETEVFEIVSEWETRTRLKMEYTDVLAIAQKDVNNYVMKVGEVYIIENGKKIVEKENQGWINTKGGYVSLYKSADFRNNSMVVLHDALVKYFMDGVPVEETITTETDVIKFQIIAKTGSTYTGTYHEVKGEKVDVQRVNRVYATTDTTYGTLKKVKVNGREDKIAGLPDHVIIDNEANMTLEKIDKQFYINVAKDRIIDYVGKRNTAKQLQINMEDLEKMSDKATSKTKTLLEKLNDIRDDFAKMGIEKNGINRYAEYKYFTLEDIVPAVRELNRKHNVTTVFDFGKEEATLTVYNLDGGDSLNMSSPMVYQAIPKGATEVQNLGAVQTYLRRYLYLMYLDIVEADEAEIVVGKEEAKAPEPKKVKTTSNKPATPKERAAAKKEIINKDGEATETQIKSIKNGLKRLREKDTSYEAYIKESVLAIKAGMSKTEAEELLLEVA
ncbi:hypothetical protein E4P35_12450, partial [Thiopseudomonas sp. 4R-3cl]